MLASSACPDHEHGDIVTAIESGDVRRAERLMLEHLDHVEHGIQPPATPSNEVDFEAIFRVDGAPAAPPRKRAGKKRSPS